MAGITFGGGFKGVPNFVTVAFLLLLDDAEPSIQIHF